MLFNTWFGQQRWNATTKSWYHNPKRPIGTIQLRDLRPVLLDTKRVNYQYKADERGNMNVTAPEHIKDFVGLGYPVYNGMFIGPASQADLLWPNNAEYDRRVLEGLNQHSKTKGV